MMCWSILDMANSEAISNIVSINRYIDLWDPRTWKNSFHDDNDVWNNRQHHGKCAEACNTQRTQTRQRFYNWKSKSRIMNQSQKLLTAGTLTSRRTSQGSRPQPRRSPPGSQSERPPGNSQTRGCMIWRSCEPTFGAMPGTLTAAVLAEQCVRVLTPTVPWKSAPRSLQQRPVSMPTTTSWRRLSYRISKYLVSMSFVLLRGLLHSHARRWVVLAKSHTLQFLILRCTS